MEKATIYDYARMCKKINECEDCPLGTRNNGVGIACSFLMRQSPDKANEIILKWCKEHPIETRQDRFLKMFPNALRFENSNIIAIKPCDMDKDYASKPCTLTCEECFKEYWLAEIDKQIIKALGLSPSEYEQAIRKLTERLGI